MISPVFIVVTFLLLNLFLKFFFNNNTEEDYIINFFNFEIDLNNYIYLISGNNVEYLLFFLIFIFIILTISFEVLTTLIAVKLQKFFIYDIRELFTNNLLNKKMSYFNEDINGELNYIFNSIINRLSSFIVQLFYIFSTFFKSLILFLMLLFKSIYLTFFVGIFAISIIFIFNFFSSKLNAISKKLNEISALNTGFYIEFLSLIKLLKRSSKQSELYKDKLLKLGDEREEELLKFKKLNVYLRGSILFYSIIFIVFIIVFSKSNLLSQFNYSSDFLISFFLILFGLAFYFLKLVDIYHLVISLIPQIEILKQKIQANKDNEVINLHGKTVNSVKNITIVDGQINYGSNLVLSSINIEFKSGQSYCIVGKSGSGKSTLLEILSLNKMLDKGQMLINGKKINDYNLIKIRDKFGYLQQDISILNDDLEKNVIFFKGHKENLKYQKSIKSARLTQLLTNKKRNFKDLGNKGSKLSGGEKQRLALSRIFYMDPEVIIFDEATSALDKKNEEVVIDNLLKNFSKKIIICVTHNHQIKKKFDYVINIREKRLTIKNKQIN